MINNLVGGIGGKPPVDPFQNFSVEFNGAMTGKMDGLGDGGMPQANFGEVLNHALTEVQGTQAHADQLAFDFATGKPVDIHTMMISLAKADVLMQVTSSVVSKTAQSMNTLLQTQV